MFPGSSLIFMIFFSRLPSLWCMSRWNGLVFCGSSGWRLNYMGGEKYLYACNRESDYNWLISITNISGFFGTVADMMVIILNLVKRVALLICWKLGKNGCDKFTGLLFFCLVQQKNKSFMQPPDLLFGLNLLKEVYKNIK